MAPLPKPMSRAAFVIEAAIAEGRTAEALQKLVHALRQDQDDKAVRRLAADWIERIGLPPGAPKALRQGAPALREEWLEIADMVAGLQAQSKTYTEAVQETAAHFGYSERHVQACVADWKSAVSQSQTD
ncbi:hypothetical protein DEM27_31140 [Metarhizobium album]|uniref:Uncharacterized protein n=1 Tax=Metarhizobium album TaxID=2182425 RepID=A0A2U2DGF5_9HYPH|nr:hypothetical protein [Rhizobium album]PWE52403.1 hypothetical protein DEM27_31140 [Rhizobium album]